MANNSEMPNFYKNIFPYYEIPKIKFNNQHIPINLPDKIWITDTTFRDGQQSMPSFTEKQILKIFDYLNMLDNNSGVIRQTEFFLYTDRDRDAAYKCMEKGYDFPEVTSWIRANKKDFQLVKDMEIKETGILMSCSDYHIFKKLGSTREKVMEMYLDIVEESLKFGIIPRCHLEDITRADFYGFIVPFVNKLMECSKKAGIPVKVRLCDTLGLGVPHSGVCLPRSVQSIMEGMIKECKVPSEYLEWHGHNDFYSVVNNATTAWLYGCSSVNTALLGIGERTGNCPLEAMIFEYAQIKGTTDKMNIPVITDIADYFRREMGYDIHCKTPFVGSEFNVTRAGIHADGILKDEGIYNIFDTDKILNRPILVSVNQYSGVAGVAAWINTYFKLKEDEKISKNHKSIGVIKKWIDDQYKNGRVNMITNDEMKEIVLKIMPNIV